MTKKEEINEKPEKTMWEDIEIGLDQVQGEDENIIDESDIGELEPEFEDITSNINIEESESELDIYFKFMRKIAVGFVLLF